jgi:50S ribosomal protein L16 3-hydroxylase
MHLQNFDTEFFLRDIWQKKPLLIRNPWTSWVNPIDPDELAGLACEPQIEARLVFQTPDSWALEHGPFEESRFDKLGKSAVTLLVQAVDQHVPDVAALFEPFRFIPNWRIDDVMVSYATDGGGVGPHFDQYDVFLIQGQGKRRWQVGVPCDDETPLLPHHDLRLLAQFEPVEEWILEPGDILYVPPRVAHNGIAVGEDCMTHSIGFRAPSRGELIGGWSDHLVAEMADDDRYQDAYDGSDLPQNPGEISSAAIARLHAMVIERMADQQAFARWFGQHSSTPKYPEMDWRPEEFVTIDEVRARLAHGQHLRRNPASRFSFIRQAAALSFFVDGQCFECAGDNAALAEQLCAQDHIRVAPDLMRSDQALTLLVTLLNQGSIGFDDDDE